MNKKLQTLIRTSIATVLLIGSVTALATSGTKTLNAGYRNIKLVVDGSEVMPRDVNGNIVEPFIVDGTTYLPLRAVAEALGKDVDWDPNTNTVSVNDNSIQTTAPKEEGHHKIGVSLYRFDNYFMTFYRQEIERYFKSLETKSIKYEVIVMDAKEDQSEQNRQVDLFIAQQVDVMIINLVQSSQADTVTQKAKAANIPIVFINREPSEHDMKAWSKISYVGSDARQAGTYQGEIIRDLPKHGDINGDGVVSYVMIIGDPENIDAQYRTEYSIRALTDAGVKVEELFAQRGDWDQAKGQELAANALAQYGLKIDVIFCNNDGMAIGAIQAIKAAGRTVGKDIYLVGIDAIPEAIEAIAAGDMTGTVLNDYIGQSHTAVDAAVKYINGKDVDTYLWVTHMKVA